MVNKNVYYDSFAKALADYHKGLIKAPKIVAIPADKRKAIKISNS